MRKDGETINYSPQIPVSKEGWKGGGALVLLSPDPVHSLHLAITGDWLCEPWLGQLQIP